MFNLFSKKGIDEEAAKAFWVWFAEQESWIIDCITKHDSAFIWAIDERLKPVFPYFKKNLNFSSDTMMGSENSFLSFWQKELIRDSETLRNMMPPEIANNWKFILEK